LKKFLSLTRKRRNKLAPPQGLLEALIKATPEIAGLKTEIELLRAAQNQLTTSIGEGGFAAINLLGKVRQLQKEALVDLGLEDYNKQINQTVGLFQKLNSSSNRLGINFKTISDIQFDLTKKFEGSGISLGNLNQVIAANSNLVKDSTLIEFSRDLAFQTPMTSKQIGDLQNRIIGLSVALRRPPAQILGLVKELAASDATFAQSGETLLTLATRAELAGRRLGISGKSINQTLQSTETIQARIQEGGRLQYLASRLGLDVDLSGIYSQDPVRRQRAILNFAQAVSEAGAELPPGLKSAFSIALRGTATGQALGGAGRRALLSGRRLDLREIEGRIAGAQPADIGALRRDAVTAAQVLQTQREARAVTVGLRQIQATTLRDRQLGDAARVLDRAAIDISTRVARAAGQGVEQGVRTAFTGVGAGLQAGGILQTGVTGQNLATQISTLLRVLDQLVGELRRGFNLVPGG
jgi:hypothetical protein